MAETDDTAQRDGDGGSHVSGIVVHAPAERAAAVAAAIDAREGAEVYAREGGKLIVVLEAADERALGDLFQTIQLMDGVYSCALVSHYRDEPELLGGD